MEGAATAGAPSIAEQGTPSVNALTPTGSSTGTETFARQAWAAIADESNAEYAVRQSLSANPNNPALDLMKLTTHIGKVVRVHKMAESLLSEQETLSLYMEKLTASEDEYILEAVDELIAQVFLVIEVVRSKLAPERYRRLLGVYERLCISLLGHENQEAREDAVRLLNVIYDRLDWQFYNAHVPVIRCAGDAFDVSAIVQLSAEVPGEPSLMLSAPPFSPSSKGENIITFHKPDVREAAEMVGAQCVRLGNIFREFPRAGFYDWRYVFVTSTGDLLPLKLPNGDIAQGRFVVQPRGLREEMLHELVVDMTGQRGDPEKEQEGARDIGTFHNIYEIIPSLLQKGYSTVYVMGALERDNGVRPEQQIGGETALACERPGASPVAVTCRRTPNRMLGGKAVFQKITAAAKSQGMRIMTQCSANISASRYHRRYRDLIVKTLDDKGELVPHRGSDAKANQWEDQVLLNYRKLETWEVLVEDVLALQALGVGGVYVQQAQSWPPILAIDSEELRRVDLDGEPVYEQEDIFYGNVVRTNDELGFWSTQAAETYPNPLLVKLARTLWAHDPSFLLLGKTYWGRTGALVTSGLVPRDIGMAAAIAQVRGRKVDKDGRVTLVTPANPPIQPLYLWLVDQCQLPEGSLPVQVRSICQETLPYPAHLFGRTAWTAIDLMYLLPGLPMTFIGEEEGAVYRMDLGNIYSKERTEEWRMREREEKLQQQMERERRRMEQKRRLALRAIQEPSPGPASFTGSSSHSLARTGSNASLKNNKTGSNSSLQGLDNDVSNLRLSRSGSLTGGDSDNSVWRPPLQSLHHQSAASLSTVSSTESLRKILEKALQEEGEMGEHLGMSSNSLQRVQSWSAFEASIPKELEEPTKTVSTEAPEGLPKARSASRVDVLNHKALAQLEAKARADLGPEFGFDLGKIYLHYQHRQQLRRESEVLRHGLTGVIEARKPSSSQAHDFVFAFVRWIPEGPERPPTIPQAKEVCLIASNFSTEHANFTLHLEPLKFLLEAEEADQPEEEEEGELGERRRGKSRASSSGSYTSRITGFWECSDLLHEGFAEEIKNDAISSYELLHNLLPVSLRPHASMCLHLRWVTETPEEAERRLMTSALGRIRRALNATEYEPSSGGPTFNPSDEEIMEQLRNNFVFMRFEKALRAAAENHEDAPLALLLALRPLQKILHSGGAEVTDLIRKTLFFAARYCNQKYNNALSDADVITILQSLSEKGAEPIVGTRESVMEVDISSFISTTADPKAAGSFTSGKAALPPKELPLSEKLAGRSLLSSSTTLASPSLVSASSLLSSSPHISKLAAQMLESNKLGPIVFIAPELGRWSTVGGLGVMVDELTRGLAQLGASVTVISPYYERNRKGQTGYLAKDNIHWKRNLHIRVGGVFIEAGIHEGRVNGVHLLFIHHSQIFPYPYPSGNAWHQVRMLSFVAKASLEALCQLRLIPSLIVTNDWFAGLVAAYARTGHFGRPSVFSGTKFLHLVHNLDENYEGRQYPAPHEGDLYGLHQLPVDLLVDPYWGRMVINPSRAALLASDTWATVSISYKKDLLSSSPLCRLLERARHPFATSNGVPIVLRRSTLLLSDNNSHFKAKAALQRKYFHMAYPDPNIPIFSFVGRVTEQKGVHLILDAAEQVIRETEGRVQIICGGPSSEGDPYGSYCAGRMRWLARTYSGCFWADPGAFFTDGPLVNLGSDFGLMPSLFEPGGIVQHEFFSAGTPVIAFKTGGLKDSVHEYSPSSRTGNGFTFEAHTPHDLIAAIRRALSVFRGSSGEYQHLRANAAASVIDVADVAVAWLYEFDRICRCINLPIYTVFRYSGKHQGHMSVVKLVGSFNQWSTASAVECTYKEDQNEFQASIRMYPGTYTYKFIVDGEWTCAHEYPKVKDEEGSENNVVTVSYGPSSK